MKACRPRKNRKPNGQFESGNAIASGLARRNPPLDPEIAAARPYAPVAKRDGGGRFMPGTWQFCRENQSRSNPAARHAKPATILGNQKLALALMDWQAGQGDPIYAVASSWYARRPVPRDLVESALSNLEWFKSNHPKQSRGIGVVIAALKFHLNAP